MLRVFWTLVAFIEGGENSCRPEQAFSCLKSVVPEAVLERRWDLDGGCGSQNHRRFSGRLSLQMLNSKQMNGKL